MSRLPETAGNGKALEIVEKVLTVSKGSFTLEKLGREPSEVHATANKTK